MKSISLIICLLIISLINGVGQEKVLVAKKKKNDKIRLIHDGKRLKVFDLDNHMIKGRLMLTDTTGLLTDKEIMVGETKVNIDEIKKIRLLPLSNTIARTTANVLGGVSITTGILFIVEAMMVPNSNNKEENNSYEWERFGYIIGGVVCGGIGLFLIFTAGIIYSITKVFTKDRYDFYIMNK